ncbi:DNA-binding transcription factor [Basidiobolus ranarum]|uniref:DNA-binding transcription factor n=1 Tax=Basidiobolus ranarum TaxID=34480 RepID=A0ABR2W4H9_9FUNG
MSITNNGSFVRNHLLDSNFFPDLLLSDLNASSLLEGFTPYTFSNSLEAELTSSAGMKFEFDDALLNGTFLSNEDTLTTPLEFHLDLTPSNRDLSTCESLIPLPITPTNEMNFLLDYDVTQLIGTTSPPPALRSRSSSVSTTSSGDTPFDEDWATLLLNTLKFNEIATDNEIEIVSPNQSLDQFKFIVYEPSNKGPKLAHSSSQSQPTMAYPQQVLQQSISDKNISSEGFQKAHAFKCAFPGCPKSFSRQYNLTSHMRSHSNLRPYSCGFCPRSFARKHDLQRHTRLHTGSRPYECIACCKGFPRSDALSRHYRVEEKCRVAYDNASS